MGDHRGGQMASHRSGSGSARRRDHQCIGEDVAEGAWGSDEHCEIGFVSSTMEQKEALG